MRLKWISYIMAAQKLKEIEENKKKKTKRTNWNINCTLKLCVPLRVRFVIANVH